MINENKKYYIYRHIRLDTNVPFYIGIGTYRDASTHKQSYHRAFRKANRNSHWYNIINKTHYKVEILYHSNSLEDIINKEIEFISLYKETLCNKTSGGEINKNVNKESIQLIINKNKKIALEKRNKLENKYSDNIIQDYIVNNYTINQLYKKYRIYPKTIKHILAKNNKTKDTVCYKCDVYYIYNYTLNSITKFYGNIEEISKNLNMSYSSVYNMIKGNNFKKRNFLVCKEQLEKNKYREIYEKRSKN
jgi:hypothetical protein